MRLGRDLGRQVHSDLGFKAAGVLTFRIDLKGPQYMDNRRVGDLLRLVYLPRIAAVPGVRQVALSNPTQPTASQPTMTRRPWLEIPSIATASTVENVCRRSRSAAAASDMDLSWQP